MKADPPVDVLIVGAGFAGLGSAIRLRRAGITNITWIEKDSGIGGTWWANRYPGAACDIPTPLYSFSFAPNPNWTRLYPPQAEIQAYLADTARRFGVAPQFQVELRSLAWQDDARQWLARLRDADGREFEVRARAVIAATDGLSRPKWPDIDGLHDFAGPLLHTARWRDDVALAGKRIGVIGTGASAIQLVPELARQAAGLTIFQRSAPWVVARADRPLRASERWLCAELCRYLGEAILLEPEPLRTRVAARARALAALVRAHATTSTP
ncbi:MAG: NAD(P)/FAD-dependent oxidoreductase [Burkholderiales bacterium]|nr:NAD(P)/FAD-dependent oxidoreductase [Burkholderiales bacterium]